jgi:hypothetical protein
MTTNLTLRAIIDAHLALAAHHHHHTTTTHHHRHQLANCRSAS